MKDVFQIDLPLKGGGTGGVLGVNPENNNTEVHCRRCGTWIPARGVTVNNGEFPEYYG